MRDNWWISAEILLKKHVTSKISTLHDECLITKSKENIFTLMWICLENWLFISRLRPVIFTELDQDREYINNAMTIGTSLFELYLALQSLAKYENFLSYPNFQFDYMINLIYFWQNWCKSDLQFSSLGNYFSNRCSWTNFYILLLTGSEMNSSHQLNHLKCQSLTSGSTKLWLGGWTLHSTRPCRGSSRRWSWTTWARWTAWWSTPALLWTSGQCWCRSRHSGLSYPGQT